MTPPISSFTPRQWVQMRAALRFWREVAEQSRQHPSRHPSVAPEFEQHGPLSLDELDELLAGLPELNWITKAWFEVHYDVPTSTFKRLQRNLNIEPDMYVNKVPVFRVETLIPMVEELENERRHQS